jgi:hypothetical protein
MEVSESKVYDWITALMSAEGEASEEGEFEKGELLFGSGSLAELVAEVVGGGAPKVEE